MIKEVLNQRDHLESSFVQAFQAFAVSSLSLLHMGRKDYM